MMWKTSSWADLRTSCIHTLLDDVGILPTQTTLSNVSYEVSQIQRTINCLGLVLSVTTLVSNTRLLIQPFTFFGMKWAGAASSTPFRAV